MFNTDNFSYRDRTFSAFASDFEPATFDRMFGQVFDDACDQGFELTSARTGMTVKVTLKQVHKREGDITHFEFIPYRNDSFDAVIVWND